MHTLTPANKVILRHCDKFAKRRILFVGDVQDIPPILFTISEVRLHTQQYHYWQLLNQSMGKNAQFSLIPDAKFVAKCDTLIFFWPKSKEEAQFQLYNILALLPMGTDIFVVGENRSGVRSSTKIVVDYITLMKIDYARSCSLYYGRLNIKIRFNLSDWWKSYQVHNLEVKTLPGVFSRNQLDSGSALLLSTLNNSIQGAVLEIGCGAGVIAAMLGKLSPNVKLTLSDVSAAALYSSRATLEANNIKAKVIFSNVYSNISSHFNMIISNPPFHVGLLTNDTIVKTLIYDATKHLTKGGLLRIVANAFLPYPEILNDTFGRHEVLAQNSCFKVYQAIARRSWLHLKKEKI